LSLLNIPAELRAYANWVGWKWEEKKNSRGEMKLTKPPYDLKSNGTLRHAKTDDPITWTSFEVAAAAKGAFDSRFDGVGFVLPDGMGGMDFDGVIHDERVEPFVLEILKHCGNPYTETTPSCHGVRAFINAPTIPTDPKKTRKFHGKKDGVEKYGAEIYFGVEPGRYLTVTGEKLEGSGDGITTPSDIDLVHFLMSQFGNEKFKSLWTGDTSAYENDHSAADLALMNLLARLTNNDRAKMERYFGASVLGQREKWTQRENYRSRTLDAALKGKTQNPHAESGGSPPVVDVEEYEPNNAIVSTYPAMGNDLISRWARLATDGTGIPFGHVRENLKVLLAFCLSDTVRYPNHESLYPRGWHFNIGDAESGKTTALIFVLDRWRSVLTDLGIRIDKLSSYGSLQFLTKGFEDNPRMFLYVTEGNTLANANEHIAAIFSGLSDLYDQSVISAGSYKNKPASCVTAQGSSIICFTPDDYLKALEGKGVIGGGVLPRWTMSESKKIAIAGDWATPPEAELRDLQNQMMGRFNDVRVIETAEAKIVREALKDEMDRPEAGRHGKRLIEHFKRECLLAAVFAPSNALNEKVGVITKEIAEWAAQWARYQLHLRIALWPVDAGSDVERMCSLMRALLQRANPKAVSLKQLKDACNVYRQGSGGIEAFGRAYRAMIMNEEMRKVGKNSRGKDLFGLVLD
jgi:hypothetical protein